MSATTHTLNTELVQDLETFLGRYYREDVLELANRYPSEQESLEIHWSDLFQFNPSLGDDALDAPKLIIEHLEQALGNYDLPIDIDISGARIRLAGLHEDDVYDVGGFRPASQIGRYLGISGQVSKVSGMYPYPEEAVFVCQRCGTENRIPQLEGELQEPHECDGCERQGPFQIDWEQSVWRDEQLVRLKQPPEETQGAEGNEIDILVKDDLVDQVKPGDRIETDGIYSVSPPDSGNRFETHLDGRAIDIHDSDFEDIDYDEHMGEIQAIAQGDYGDPIELFAESIAPRLHGYESIKTAIALQFFGGVHQSHDDGSEDRGDFHILLLGDPGLGKSTMLRAAEKIAPRSVYASGKGATAAGMTAAAVPESFGDSEWSLEAGALVQAHKGIACVDEIDKVKEDAVSSMHEALEDQRININKGPFSNVQLPARTSLLAAGNPIYGRFDLNELIAEQIDLAPALISRFDLLFMLSDHPDRDTDGIMADHIIESRWGDENGEDPIEMPIERDVFRAYIAYAKQEVFPAVSTQAVKNSVKNYFVELRQAGGKEGPVSITPRQLEAIVRLSEAAARARLSTKVEDQDVKLATGLVQESMRQIGIDPESGEMDVDIIETGKSHSQRERMQKLEDLAEEECQSGPIQQDDFVEKAVDEFGFQASKIRHTMKENWFKRGWAYDPTGNDSLYWIGRAN